MVEGGVELVGCCLPHTVRDICLLTPELASIGSEVKQKEGGESNKVVVLQL